MPADKKKGAGGGKGGAPVRKNPPLSLSPRSAIGLSAAIVIACALLVAGTIVLARPELLQPRVEEVAHTPPPAAGDAVAPPVQGEDASAARAVLPRLEPELSAPPEVPVPGQPPAAAGRDDAPVQPRVAAVPAAPSAEPGHAAPQARYDVPPARNGAMLCFVIDDAGLHADNVRRYAALPFPLTIAVLPRLSQSAECAAAVRAGGKELILHQPMQAHDYPSGKTPDPGPGAVRPGMGAAEVSATIRGNLDSLGPGVRGFNNHEGSLVTEDAGIMAAALAVAEERGVYFLDSRTTSRSAVPQAASARGMAYIARYAPFLDNEVGREEMLRELYRGLETANRNGYAVIIGHVDKSVAILPGLLADIYPSLVRQGYRLGTPSQLQEMMR